VGHRFIGGQRQTYLWLDRPVRVLGTRCGRPSRGRIQGLDTALSRPAAGLAADAFQPGAPDCTLRRSVQSPGGIPAPDTSAVLPVT